MTPYGNRVIVRKDRQEKAPTYEGTSILRPETLRSAEDKCRGWVEAVGPKCEQAKRGDYVLYQRYAEQQGPPVDGEDLYVMTEADLLVCLESSPENCP